MDNAISFEELDGVAGELLPERTVMGIVAAPLAYGPDGDGGAGAGAGSSSSSSATASGGGVYAPPAPDHGTTMLAACQSVDRQQNAGLLSALGLNAQNPATGLHCVPAAVSSH
ncbi:hypothetical protein AF335_15575 [Streptomyces eurocidicus]|uniref:Uncharacterized protein n=1 Tax=Streptomyces eurocidicus TaxID=66423 RepID=A0A2N8NVY1_STREU|nr:hypothetical protein [Streptomyces eurocidicus]MBB5119117.1 hypothetical protein [Streptomyces eurocidicus]MBF6050435.1 hypothetical protein [Streptomyces eurocidicus]PNE32927.1 hypothetical protein AF335_15575 [Streptomyces eurocidicus]